MKKEIKIVFIITFIVIAGNSLANVYFSAFALDKGVNESIVGLMISTSAIMTIIVAPYYTKILSKFGRKNLFVGSLFSQVIWFLMLTKFLENLKMIYLFWAYVGYMFALLWTSPKYSW